MRWNGWTCVVALALASAVPAAAQELRGFLVLEGDPGYLTNAYLDPGFATWAPEVETAFGSAAGTGLLEWVGGSTTVSAAATGRWMELADSTPSWRLWSVRGGAEQRLGRRWRLAADGSYSEIRRLAERRTLWGQLAVRWVATPRLRLTLGPGVARRRFPAPATTDGGLLDPIVGDEPAGAESGTARATSILLFAGLEAWPGRRWRVRGDAYGSHTEAADLGIDYRGGGGTLRVTRWLPSGVSLTAAAGVEGFGYRAAVETVEDPSAVPENDLIWRTELGVGWPLGRQLELSGRLAGLGRSGAGEADGGPDVYAAAGLRVTLGGTLSSRAGRAWSWTREGSGMRIRVPYRGPGRLYLVGDFNGWGRPGVPLRQESPGVHAAVLPLEPGSYRYRVRVVSGDGEDWLDLPESLPTVEDGFGGQNGLLVVGEDPAATDLEPGESGNE